MFCRLLFVLLYFFFWTSCCLLNFDIRILIAPLVIFKLFLFSHQWDSTVPIFSREISFSYFWDRPVPIFSDVRFSYLPLVQDRKITCVLPANACCTVYVNSSGKIKIGLDSDKPRPIRFKSYPRVSQILLSCTSPSVRPYISHLECKQKQLGV